MNVMCRCGRRGFGRKWVLAWSVALAAGTGSADVAGAGTTYYVSPTGSDGNPGTGSLPFRTVQRGVDALAGGDMLVLRAGRYVGPVIIKDKAKIAIAASPGETATIEGYLPLDGSAVGWPSWPVPRPPVQWEPASLYDPDAHPEEFVSIRRFTEDQVNRGAFLELRRGVPLDRHVRLISYSRLEDLRADNQTWEPLESPDELRPGGDVFLKCGCLEVNPACQTLPDGDLPRSCAGAPPNRYKPAGFLYPWVYMGPGLWFDKTTGRVHVRLSHTRNGVTGLADYTGVTDPRQIALAIAPKEMQTLRVERSSNVLIKNVAIRFGGQETVVLDHVTGVTFDRVRIWAGTRAVHMASASTVVFRHCLFDGGLPEWHFRNDLKGEYYFLDDATRVIGLNGRGNTADTLLLGSQSGADQGVVIEHSEFVNGHDLYLSGTGLRFHHNWIRNLNDEALFLDAYPLRDALIHENLIERSLSGISMAGEGPNSIGGARHVYRNVFDLREPTAGTRPRRPGDTSVWRYGHLFKSNDTDGPLDLFHNTFIVQNQEGQAAYLHLDSRSQVAPRRSFNNIFLAVNADPDADTKITYLPDPNSAFETDGNDYFRFGFATAPPFRYLAYDCGRPTNCPGGTFSSLAARSADFQRFEEAGLELDPQFASFSAAGGPQATDDFRLSDLSLLDGAGVALPPELAELDRTTGAAGAPDIGACPLGITTPLRVGIDGRRTVCRPH